MSGMKLTARQKMINMMYLVLTALLALNVSKEIIKAFNLMENSLDASSKSIQEKNRSILASLETDAKEDVAAQAATRHFREVHKLSEGLVAQLAGIKQDLLKLTEGRMKGKEGELVKGGLNELVQGDNMEIHGNYFVSAAHGGRGKGLQMAINQTRNKMIAVLDAAIADPQLGADPKMARSRQLLADRRNALMQKGLLTAEDNQNSEGKSQSWVSMYLENAPLAGVFAILSKLENDARALESEIGQTLAESVGASSATFNTLIPVIRPKSAAVLTNQTYEAEILLAAYDSKTNMMMTVDGAPVEVNNGMGMFRATHASPGEYNFRVGIRVPGKGGRIDTLTQEGSYTVFAPSAAISADGLNVIYEGLENPLTITVAGVKSADVRVTVTSSGDVQLKDLGNGRYNALCPLRRGNEATVNVFAKLDGREVAMASKKFRIRKVPPPRFVIGPYTFSEPIPLSGLKMQKNASADLPGFVYEGVSYRVESFHFTAFTRRGEYIEKTVTGSSMATLAGDLAKLRANDMISIDRIRVSGPGGAIPIAGVTALLK